MYILYTTLKKKVDTKFLEVDSFFLRSHSLTTSDTLVPYLPFQIMDFRQLMLSMDQLFPFNSFIKCSILGFMNVLGEVLNYSRI